MTSKRQRRAYSFPVNTLEQALSVAQAIQEANTGQPYDRIQLAGELGTTPSSSVFTRILGSSSRYELTQGNYNSPRISLTPLGRAVVAPTSEEERVQGLAAAAMNPDVFNAFYRRYNGKKLPESNLAKNFLSRELGVHADLVDECLKIAIANGKYAGIFHEVSGAWYVSWEQPASTPVRPGQLELVPAQPQNDPPHVPDTRRVFVGHDGRPEAAQFVHGLLEGFGIGNEVVAMADDAQPVSKATAKAMKASSAAVLVFTYPDSGEAQSPARYRDWMLLQLGAASLQFGQSVVVFAEDGLLSEEQSLGSSVVPFQKGRFKDAMASLMMAMHQTGVIKVSG
ncbi:MAG: hypothetical protein O2854_07645 [Chloroflexi bacterium]|nr:hypothetical protein [Chloroflexota bacterium]